MAPWNPGSRMQAVKSFYRKVMLLQVGGGEGQGPGRRWHFHVKHFSGEKTLTNQWCKVPAKYLLTG